MASEKFLKVCLMTFNIICLFVGIATFTGGLLIQFVPTVQTVLKTMSEAVSETNIGILSVIMLAIGGLVILVSFVGCCGVMSESKCMIGLYCAFLILMMLGQVVIGALGVYYGKQGISDTVEEHFKKLIKEYRTDEKVLDAVQEQFQCCGYNGPNDYPPKTMSPTTVATVATVTTSAGTMTISNATAAVVATTLAATTVPPTTTTTSTVNTGNATQSPNNPTTTTTMSHTGTTANMTHYTGGYPMSCCKKGANATDCQDLTKTITELKDYLNEEGCKDSIERFISNNAILIGGIALGLAFLEILSIIAGCMLYKSLD